MRKLKFLLAASLALTSVSTARGEEWPRVGGPNGDGISHETKLLTEWPATGPTKLWTIPTGLGHASPIAVAGKLFLFTFDSDTGEESLEAFDAETGKQIWKQSYAGGYNNAPNNAWLGTRATPTIDGTRIFTYGGSGDLVCRELADGKEVWHINVLKLTNADTLEWGTASSPLVAGDAVYVQGGRGKDAPVAVSVNKNDGKFLWQSASKGSASGAPKGIRPGIGGGYAAPIMISVAGAKQLIVFGGTAVYAMDPASGKELWKLEWRTDYDVNATTPIYHEPNLLISSGYTGHACAMFEISASGAKELWRRTDSLGSRFPAIILDRGYLYGNSEGTLKCVSWADGKTAWAVDKDPLARLGPGGSLVRFGDYLITLSEGGKLTLAKATPEKYEKITAVKGFVKSPKSNIWATPLIYHGKLYVKGYDELVCADITGK